MVGFSGASRQIDFFVNKINCLHNNINFTKLPKFNKLFNFDNNT